MSDLLDWLIQNEPTFRKSRLPSLFSDLAIQRTTNPDGYAANISAWQSALAKAALAGKLPASSPTHSLTLQASEELLSAFSSPQYGCPLGLGAVLDDSVQSRKMIPLTDFLNSERSIYSGSWIPSPWTVFRWSLRKVGLWSQPSLSVNGRLRAVELVLVAAAEHIADEALKAQEKRGSSLTDRIISRETFAQDLDLSLADSEVLLKFLARGRQVLSYDSNTVKFRAPSSPTPEPITSQDTTISSLKMLLTSLKHQTDVLSTRISSLSHQASTSVKTGNRISALSALRSKKLAEKTLQSRSDTLHQLEEVFTKIEQAADQVEIVAVMQSSANVLRGLNQKTGGVEAVEDVVLRLREEMSMTGEVGAVLREPLSADTVDDDELDSEFEAMEVEETRRRLAEVDRKEQEEKAQQVAELEERARTFKEKQTQRELSSRIDGPVQDAEKRLSQMSLEDEGTEKYAIEASERERQAVAEQT